MFNSVSFYLFFGLLINLLFIIIYILFVWFCFEITVYMFEIKVSNLLLLLLLRGEAQL